MKNPAIQKFLLAAAISGAVAVAGIPSADTQHTEAAQAAFMDAPESVRTEEDGSFFLAAPDWIGSDCPAFIRTDEVQHPRDLGWADVSKQPAFDPAADAETHLLRSEAHSTIECAKGTRMYIPPLAFEHEDGSLPEGRVELRVNEYLSIDDIVLAKLSTTSGGQLLETGGMLHIAASCNGRELRLREGKAISFQMPYAVKADMQLFEGVQEEPGDSPDWQVMNPGGETDESNALDQLADPSASVKQLFFRDVRSKDAVERIQDLVVYPRSAIIEGKAGRIPLRACMTDDSTYHFLGIMPGLDGPLTAEVRNAVTEAADFGPQPQNGSSAFNMLFSFNTIKLKHYPEQMGTMAQANYAQGQNRRLTFVEEQMRRLFETIRLGWINVDRFIKSMDALPLVVNLPQDLEEEVNLCLVLDGSNTMISATHFGDEFRFLNVPRGMDATLVVFTDGDGEKLEADLQRIKITDAYPVEVSLQELSRDDFRKALRESRTDWPG